MTPQCPSLKQNVNTLKEAGKSLQQRWCHFSSETLMSLILFSSSLQQSISCRHIIVKVTRGRWVVGRCMLPNNIFLKLFISLLFHTLQNYKGVRGWHCHLERWPEGTTRPPSLSLLLNLVTKSPYFTSHSSEFLSFLQTSKYLQREHSVVIHTIQMVTLIQFLDEVSFDISTWEEMNQIGGDDSIPLAFSSFSIFLWILKGSPSPWQLHNLPPPHNSSRLFKLSICQEQLDINEINTYRLWGYNLST